MAFLVDGFNLYHSIKQAERRSALGRLRWLDIHALCSTILRSAFGPRYALQEVHYFSALAKHLENQRPDVVRRHRTYREALEATGVTTSFSNFKKRDREVPLDRVKVRWHPFRRRWTLRCSRVRIEWRTHEEKETDVAIACRALELLHRQVAEAIVLVTGDTDVAPFIRTAAAIFPTAEIAVAFPFNRYNEGLAKLAHRRLKLDPDAYHRHQLPDSVLAPSGKRIVKPKEW